MLNRRTISAGVLLVLLAGGTLAGGLGLPKWSTYWPVVFRHAWRRVSLRDASFPWHRRLESSLRRWERELLSNGPGDDDEGVSLQERGWRHQAASYLLRFPDLLVDEADPVLLLASSEGSRKRLRISLASAVARKQQQWFRMARQVSPDDPVIMWQAALELYQRARIVDQEMSHYRELLLRSRAADPDNAIWYYMLSGCQYQMDVLMRSRGTTSRLSGDFSSDPSRAGHRPAASAAWTTSIEWAQQASQRTHYQHPHVELQRRVQAFALKVGLDMAAQRKLQTYLEQEFRPGDEFGNRFSPFGRNPGFVYWTVELNRLDEALKEGDTLEAGHTCRRLVRLIDLLWDAYPALADRQRLLDLLLASILLQKKNFPLAQGEQRDDGLWSRLQEQLQQYERRLAEREQVATPKPASQPVAPTREKLQLLVCADSLARVGLALAMVGGFSTVMLAGFLHWRTPADGPRRELTSKWLPPAAIALAVGILLSVESAIAWWHNRPTRPEFLVGLGPIVFIPWTLVWSGLTVLLAKGIPGSGDRLPRNAAVLLFAANMLGLYGGAVHLNNFGVGHYGTFDTWPNAVQLLIDPVGVGSYGMKMVSSDLATLLLAPATMATVLAGFCVYLRWRRWREQKRLTTLTRPEADQRFAAWLQKETAVRPEAESASVPLPPARFSGVLVGMSLLLLAGWVWVQWTPIEISLAAACPEEVGLREGVIQTKTEPSHLSDIVSEALMRMVIRPRSAIGFWQFVVLTLGMTAVLTVSVPIRSGEGQGQTRQRFPDPLILGHALARTSLWLVFLGASAHVGGTLVAAYVLQWLE